MAAPLRKHESSALRLIVTLIHLSVWAQLGVVTRAFLGKFFLLGCGGGWGPCLQGSLYFKDLPSNMLGSFVIGLFAASSTVGLSVDKALALLPKGHPWQANFELQIGIRTGYCGSLTTFASWFLELMAPAIQHNLWVEAAMGLAVGMMAAVASYQLGLHAALAADRWLVGERDVLEQLQQYRSSQVEYLEGLRPNSGEAQGQQLLMQAEPDIPRLVAHESAELAELHRRLHHPPPGAAPGGISAPAPDETPQQLEGLPACSPAGTAVAAAPAAAAAAAAPEHAALARAAEAAEAGRAVELAVGLSKGAGSGGSDDVSTPFAAAAGGTDTADKPCSQQQQRKQQNGAADSSSSSSQPGDDGRPGLDPPLPCKPPPSQPGGRLTVQDFGASLRGHRTDAAALLCLLAFTAAAAVGVALEEQHTWLRTIWLSVLLGPPGCILRWYLSRYNYRLPGAWDWYPAGTFAANMLGVTVDFGLQCVLQRRPDSVGYWGGLLIGAVQTGFCGSLTTVSTFVTEVVKFADAIPEHYQAYRYTALSLGGGTLVSLVLYGWSVWAYE